MNPLLYVGVQGKYWVSEIYQNKNESEKELQFRQIIFLIGNGDT